MVLVFSDNLSPSHLILAIYTHSPNHSINKSPRWFLSEAWDLKLPLRLVESVWPFWSYLCVTYVPPVD